MASNSLCNSVLAVFLLAMVGCSPAHLYVQNYQPQQYVIKKEDVGDSSMIAMLKPYKRGMDTQMNVVIGHTDIPLTKAQPESTLGYFFSDATLIAARKLDSKVVAAVGNYGGIRLPYIAPGVITKGRLYELMPFDNMLTIVEIPGSVLQQFCDAMAARKGWPISGITYTIKDKTAVDVMVDGAALNSNMVYKIAVNDYVARGGDNCDFLQPLKKRYTSIFLRDAMIEYVAALERDGKPLHPVLEKRIQYAE
jgi:2',3'-cyclic-nucleotide 2'-phosphodiesterase (5'-nucleotidase family)